MRCVSLSEFTTKNPRSSLPGARVPSVIIQAVKRPREAQNHHNANNPYGTLDRTHGGGISIPFSSNTGGVIGVVVRTTRTA